MSLPISYTDILGYMYSINVNNESNILGYPTGYSQHNTPNTW